MIWPDEGLTLYPLTVLTENEYVPFGSENVIEFDVDVWVVPFSVTDQLVPDCCIFSVIVTFYFILVNFTLSDTDAPFTVL